MKNNLKKVSLFFVKYHYLFLFILFGLFLYLRYFHLGSVAPIGFDQTRDVYKARDILHGQVLLQGPWTGNGHLHIGPLYFYLLAPVLFLFNLDPIAADYLNILFNIFNFIGIYFFITKLFNKNWGLLAISIYTFNTYYIQSAMTPWNVSPMIGLACFIFYSMLKIYEGKFRWVYLLATLAGLYFHAHFTAVFLPFIILPSLIFVKDKKKLLKYLLLSLPLYLIWFIPNILSEVLKQNSDGYRYKEFATYFYHGFHLKFFFYRLPYNFILFGKTFSIFGDILQFLIPILYAVIVIFFEKERKEKIMAYIIALSFLVPILGFTIYAGPISEYYFLHVVPLIFYILIYLQKKLLKKHLHIGLVFLIIFWGVNFYLGAQNFWIKKTTEGITIDKAIVRQSIKKGEKIPFDEGSMPSYLYSIWTQDGKRF